MATKAPKNVLVFGGTGPSGLLFVKKALEHGHQLTLNVRNEGKLSEEIKKHANLKRIIQGQLTDASAIMSAAQDQHIVVSILGPKLDSPTSGTVFADAYKLIVAAMKQRGINRILVLGTVSIIDAQHDKSSLMRKLLITSIKTVAPSAYAEIIGIDRFFSTSDEAKDVEWTIYRVGGLANGVSEEVVTSYVGEQGANLNVNRAAIARWLVDEVESEQARWVKQRPLICTPGVQIWHLRP